MLLSILLASPPDTPPILKTGTDVYSVMASFLGTEDNNNVRKAHFNFRHFVNPSATLSFDLDVPADALKHLVTRINKTTPSIRLKNCTAENMAKFVDVLPNRAMITNLKIKDKSITDEGL